ncbi:MAG: excinuclease ABC subunit UvrC [Spirochaetes bacterium]|nr:excinuclease ABC subunit UvrC [Spirochaetota bacterium]
MGENKAQRIVEFRKLARTAPESPGVYIMKDADGSIIYVGKAKVLRNRLSSYFSGRKDAKTRLLVSRIASIEWILTPTDYEALLLENEFIKKHAPKYNINLKDGKTYPAIRVTNEEFPRVFRTRRVIDDGSRYYGPFPSAETIDAYIDLIRRLFPLRRCFRLRKRSSPCMYYHIGRCPAPCSGHVARGEYMETVEAVEELLSGKTDELLTRLRTEMDGAAAGLRFEKAAELRDAAAAVDTFRGANSVIDFDPESRDYAAWAVEGSMITFVVFSMRQGRLSGRDLFRSRAFGTEEEAVHQFLTSYYDGTRLPPPRVFVAAPIEANVVARYFLRELGTETALLVPDERRHEAAMAMAIQNAREDILKRRRETGDAEALEELGKVLGLPGIPVRIEGFDIAQLSGKHTVASLVSFLNGVPDRKNYRYFKIRSLDGAIDDFGSIREAVGRRYLRLLNEEAELPDLVMVDGGIGQANAARGVLDDLELDIPVVGLAKENEELWLPGRKDPVVLPKDSIGLRVLVALRDETHRVATGLNQRLRGKEVGFGVLESVKGIGAAKAARIMQTFGSLAAVAEAEPAYLEKAAGVSREAADALKEAALEAGLKPGAVRAGDGNPASAGAREELS